MKAHISPMCCRSILRVFVGALVGMGILAASCYLLPNDVDCWPAFFIAAAFAVLIGLQLAVPPLNPEDDWIQRFTGRHHKRGNRHETQPDKTED